MAVYGTLTVKIPEPTTPPVPSQSLSQSGQTNEIQSIITHNNVKADWQGPVQNIVPIEYSQQPATQYPRQFSGNETYNQAQEYNEFYEAPPKDPRSYHHTPETEWDGKNQRPGEKERERDRDTRDRRDSNFQVIFKPFDKNPVLI